MGEDFAFAHWCWHTYPGLSRMAAGRSQSIWWVMLFDEWADLHHASKGDANG